jgi:hypothetical protein
MKGIGKMKARILVVTLMVLVLSALLSGHRAQARVHSPELSVAAIDQLFAAITAGKTEAALALLESGARVENRARHETYSGIAEIAAMFKSWPYPGRELSVLTHSVMSATRGLDVVTAEVAFSDRGMDWGRQKIVAVVYDGHIQKMYVGPMGLTPWQYW